MLVLVLSTSGTRTRSPFFEYEYHFMEYEFDGRPNGSKSKPGAALQFRPRLARMIHNPKRKRGAILAIPRLRFGL